MRLRHFLSGAAALTFLTVPAQAQLIHHWDFTTGVVDLVGGATPTFNNATVSGGMLHLNTSTPSYVEFAGHLVPVSGDFSVLIRYRTTGTHNTYLELMSQGSSGNAFYIGSNNNTSEYRLGDQWLSSGVAFNPDGQFHTVVYSSVDAGGSDFYVDGGLPDASIVSSPDLLFVGSGTRFGRQYGPHGEYANVDIDEIMIFGEAMTAEEISAAPEPASLVLIATGMLGVAAVARRRRKA